LTRFQDKTLMAMGCLGLLFVLLISTTYTIDFSYRLDTVALLAVSKAALLVAGLVFLWSVRASLVSDLDLLSVTLIGIIVTGAFAGLLKQSDAGNYLRHGFQYVFMLTFYLIGRHLARSYEIKRWQINVSCATILLGYTVAAIHYALTPGLHSGSYSFQPNLLLLPLAYNHNPLISVASGLLIIIGNKRAVLIGACFCIAALIVLCIAKRWKLPLSAQIGSILALCPVIAFAVSYSLSMTQLPLFDMVASRLSTQETNSPLVSLEFNKSIAGSTNAEPTKSGPQVLAPAQRKEPAQHEEKQVSQLTRLTGARDIEAASVWSVLQADSSSIWIGAGFGGSFQMIGYQRFQADVMPVHMAITSGVPLSFLFTVALVAGLWRMFLRLGQLAPMDRTLALFVLSLSLDIAVGFNATNPIIWSSVGYSLARA
jgi:hypothetical protein